MTIAANMAAVARLENAFRLSSFGGSLRKKRLCSRKNRMQRSRLMQKKVQQTLLISNLWIASYRERGGRTIEENGNRQLSENLQVDQTKTVENLVFERHHRRTAKSNNVRGRSMEMARITTSRLSLTI